MLRSDLPDRLKLKEADLTAEERRLANFVDFISEGRGSQALAKALVETELRVDQLSDQVEALRRSREKIFRPPIEWIKDRLTNIQQVLDQRTARSAHMLRNLLGPIRLEARHALHRPPVLPRGHDPRRPRPHRKTAPRWCGGRFEFFAKVETAGIEPASAIAQKVASTSVAGTLISPSTRHAGGVVGGQLRKCPRRGWSGPHRVSLLSNPDLRCRRTAAGLALAVN